jgi:hypothetical protein
MYTPNPDIKQTNFEDEKLGLLALYASHEIEALMILLLKEIQANQGADVEWIGMESLAKRVKKLNSVVMAATSEVPMPQSLHKELEAVVG